MRVRLGVYMWNFNNKAIIPIELMKHQLDLAYRWLKSGEVEGLIFHCTPLCDMNLEAVEYSDAGSTATEMRRYTRALADSRLVNRSLSDRGGVVMRFSQILCLLAVSFLIHLGTARTTVAQQAETVKEWTFNTDGDERAGPERIISRT